MTTKKFVGPDGQIHLIELTHDRVQIGNVVLDLQGAAGLSALLDGHLATLRQKRLCAAAAKGLKNAEKRAARPPHARR